MRVDRRLYLTADRSRLVAEGDKDAAFLWAIAGDEVSDDDAAAAGYKPGTVVEPVVVEPVAETPEPEQAPAEIEAPEVAVEPVAQAKPVQRRRK